MLKKIDEKILIEMMEKEEDYQKETLRLSRERTQWRIDLITSYCTMQNFYIRKKKYLKAMERDLDKKI